MNVLCINNRDLPTSILNGWKNSFISLGYSFSFWNNHNKSIFDAFDELKPDIFIFDYNSIGRGLVTCLKQNPGTKAALLVNEKEISREYTCLIKDLYLDTKKPDIIIDLHKNNVDITIKIINSGPAGDLSIYYPRDFKKEWSSDLVFIGEYNEENSNYILPLCECDYPYFIRIFNNTNYNDDWHIPNYVGSVYENNIPNIYTSSSIIIDLSYGIDPYNIWACKGFCVTNDKNNPLDTPYFDGPESLHNLIEYYMTKPETRKKISEDKYLDVIKNHTYIDKIKNILENINDA